MTHPEIELLEKLCAVQATSGDEVGMKQFVLDHVANNAQTWNCKPEIIHGPAFQDCVLLKFGVPRVAAIAHMDSIGFTARYQNQLIPIGSPEVRPGDVLVGSDRLGPVECGVVMDEEKHLYYRFGRAIERGAALAWKPSFAVSAGDVTATFVDNRAGVCNLLRVAEVIENGLLIFSTWEEHGGGSVPYLAKYFYEEHNVRKCLISDVTWQSDGVFRGNGVVISARDANIPRKSYIHDIVRMADQDGVLYQTEVEAGGSSDGREVQQSPYPVDWCFAGPCIEGMHTSRECLSLADLEEMKLLYISLFYKL